ncbi:guanine nucleotide-binding protein G(s) subunit alpha isoforms XLas [Acanthopagrus latus]|uniref:guanine nucleotide-binding protein G(s) subunit alpha isoforms XLas n=1 Tax=Acanthopagrus latus TaxID=8177 RepID=UPI00187C1589|nr:guanine nucleotide-binding protein G(s) subunit alpha isoforms XLas [Acanthopagrus latus]
MNVQLLLLLALAGPFCALTHASPTALPEDLGDEGDLPTVTEGPKLDLSLVTGAPAATEAAEVAQDQVVTDAAVAAEIDAATAAPGEAATEAAPAVVLTEEPVADTEAPVASTAAAPEQLITEAPAVEAPAPTDEAEGEDPPVVPTSAAEVEEEVLYVEVEGLSSGQVAGIVIGALLAVVILIAVVIAAVRRMGKYSP